MSPHQHHATAEQLPAAVRWSFRWQEDIEELPSVDDIALQQNAAFVDATLCDLFQLCCFQTALPSLRTPDQ